METPQQRYETTKQRLVGYSFFSPETVESVANVAQQQITYKTYQDFFDAVGIPAVQLHTTTKGNSVTFVDVAAKVTQPRGVLVVHLPMANPLDSNQLFQVATIAAAHPEYRVIAFGNPSGGKYAFREQNLTLRQNLSIARQKNIQPLLAAEIDYLKSQHIKSVTHAGYSYGALKAALETYYSTDLRVDRLICIEPVAHPRSVVQLVGDFLRTDKPLNTYVDRSGIPAFIGARKDAVNGSDYKKGLLRPVNIAITFLLARVDFISLLKDILTKWPNIYMTIAWAGDSELGNDAHMKANLHSISHENAHVHSLRFADDTHALANDIHVHAAIIRESLLFGNE